jgi:hypothetical protein
MRPFSCLSVQSPIINMRCIAGEKSWPLKKKIYIFVLIGLILGFTLDLMLRYKNSTVFYYSLVTLFSYLYVLAYNEKKVFRLIGTSFIAALFLSFPFIGLNLKYATSQSMHWVSFLVAFPVFVYIGHSFHYAFHHDNTWRVNYPTLFAAVWNTILLLFVASIFDGLAHLLIILAASIFKTVGNLYLWNLYFENMHFRLICGLTLFFVGLGIGQQNIEIIYNLRFLLLKMMYFLFPFLALISTLYLLLFIRHSLSTEADYIAPLTVLLPITILGIIFFNAYFQDGTTNNDTSCWLNISLKIYRVILFLLILMMVYKLHQNTSLDLNILVYLLMAILLGITYASTIVLSEPKEKNWIRLGNIFTALFFILAIFLINLPYMHINYTLESNKLSPTQKPI